MVYLLVYETVIPGADLCARYRPAGILVFAQGLMVPAGVSSLYQMYFNADIGFVRFGVFCLARL